MFRFAVVFDLLIPFEHVHERSGVVSCPLEHSGKKVVSWILMASRWERSAKLNWIRALWTWWLSSFLDCTSFDALSTVVSGGFLCGIHGAMECLCEMRIRILEEDGTAEGFRNLVHISNGLGTGCRPLRWTVVSFQACEVLCAEHYRFRWKYDFVIFWSLSADRPWAHSPFARSTCHHKSLLAPLGRLEWKRLRLESAGGQQGVTRGNVVE